jgi:addiction module HigA family antidote
MSLPRRETDRRPSHPGALVRIELDDLGMSITEAARRLLVSRRTLSELVNEGRGVSPEMALRLGRFFGDGPEIIDSLIDMLTNAGVPVEVQAAGRVA